MQTLCCASFKDVEFNVLDLLSEEEQFLQKIDLGIIYLQQSTMDNVVIIDGVQRILSVSLLLHAICECYKKTSIKNDKAIDYIKKNYLKSADKMRLRLHSEEHIIYEKIVNGERLSGKEKKSSVFLMLHKMWTQIKEEQLQASDILNMLNKTSVTIVEVEDVVLRDLYYSLNKEYKNLNQIALIEDYLKSFNLENQWKELISVFSSVEFDLLLFLKDFFVTKFNFNQYSENKIYDYFVNYFETMLQYLSKEEIISKVINLAKLYKDIINVNFSDEDIKRMFINSLKLTSLGVFKRFCKYSSIVTKISIKVAFVILFST